MIDELAIMYLNSLHEYVEVDTTHILNYYNFVVYSVLAAIYESGNDKFREGIVNLFCTNHIFCQQNYHLPKQLSKKKKKNILFLEVES